MKLILAMLLALTQGTVYTPGQVLTRGALLPSLCTPPDLYLLTNGLQGLYLCTGDAWVNIGQPKIFNVVDYGAKGDGVTDDTAAINAADAAACSGALGLDGITVLAQAAVYFPPGAFKHTGLTYRGAPWIGSGVNVTALNYYGSGAAINAVGSISARKILNISDIFMDGTHASAGGYGLRIGHNYRSLGALNRVRISHFPSWGIYFAADSWNMSFYDVYLSFNGATSNGGIGIDGAASTLAGFDWYDLQLENNGTVRNGIGGGMELNSTAVNKWAFHGGLWEGNQGLSEARFINGDSISLDGVYVESDLSAAGAVDGLIFGGSVNASLRTCRLTAVAGHAGKSVRFIGTSKISIDNLWIGTNWPTAISVEDTAIVTMLSEGYNNTPVTVVNGAAMLRAVAKLASLTDAATIAVNASSGTILSVVLSGNRTMGTPTNSSLGQYITFVFNQDMVGGRTVTWTAPIYKNAWSDGGNVAGSRSIIIFYYDGARWNQVSPQTVYY